MPTSIGRILLSPVRLALRLCLGKLRMTDSPENIENYIENRVEQYRNWYDLKAVKMKSYYMRGRIVSALSAVLIPVLTNVDLDFTYSDITFDLSKILVTILGTVVAVLIALEGVLHHREQWKNYRTTEQLLQTQKQLFLHRIGDYAEINDTSAFKLLVSRVEAAIIEENAITLNVLTRVDSESKDKTHKAIKSDA